MKQAVRWIIILTVLVVTIATVAVAVSSAARFGASVMLERVWRHDGGRGLPIRLARALRPTVPLWVEVEPQVHMRLDPSDYLDQIVLATGSWEPETWHGIAEHIPAGGVFVDVGAHVGYYSLKAAAKAGPSGRVIAIEPNPDTIRKLQANIRESKAYRILVYPVACSDSQGVVEFYSAQHENSSASSMSAVNAAQGKSVTSSYQVHTRRLDDIVHESGVSRVDAIKIDVEGAELLVLKGAGETLDRYHPIVAVELMEEQLKNMGSSSAQVIGFLRSHGYAPRHKYAEFGNTEFAFTPGVSGEPR
jgi:FkbM family methyltransferase